jgi:DNA-binding response OmpR family regulator
MNDNAVSAQKFVLAIDDEPEILEILKQCLESEGFPVLTAQGPKNGLDVYEKRRQEIGVVLLDYVMPEMNGDLAFECLQQIDPNVRVILLTACEDHVARKLFDSGLRGYIQKPFYLDDLLQRVREELSRA